MCNSFYIDISKSKWIRIYLDDNQLLPFSQFDYSKFNNDDIIFIIIFSDIIPQVSDIPYTYWKLVEVNIKLILVLPKPPCQVETCWDLLNKGISDILIWNNLDSLLNQINLRENKIKTITGILDSSLVRDNLVGESKYWKSILAEVIEASIYSTSNILILGESGVGKELIARLIHTLDKRKNKGKLVMVDCTTIIPELSGSEFFGHEKGSYTSSVSSRDGAFALADKGTLFLDEIGELPLTLQSELLRVIQEKMYKRVGSNIWKNTNFRLICATNRNLKILISEGNFREDLYYRISDLELLIPPLREHPGDIELLANYFLKQFCQERASSEDLEFDPEVITYIINKKYPGNVRELKQLIRRIAIHHNGGKFITLGCIPVKDRPSQLESLDRFDIMRVIDNLEMSIKRVIVSGESLMRIKNIATFLAIKVAIELENGDKQKAAERLDVSLRAVQQNIKKHHVVI